MTAMFFESKVPFIIVKFSEKSAYRYSGMELGELNIIKKKFKYKVGELVDYLKSKDYIKFDKLNLGA